MGWGRWRDDCWGSGWAIAGLGHPGAAGGSCTAGPVAGFVTLGLVAGIWLPVRRERRPRDRPAGRRHARARPCRGRGSVRCRTRPAIWATWPPPPPPSPLTLAETRNALAEAVARETTRLASEKERLEALLSDVPVGVLLCSPDHQLVFYNGPAIALMGAGPGRDSIAECSTSCARHPRPCLPAAGGNRRPGCGVGPDLRHGHRCAGAGRRGCGCCGRAGRATRLCADPARCDRRPRGACRTRGAFGRGLRPGAPPGGEPADGDRRDGRAPGTKGALDRALLEEV